MKKYVVLMALLCLLLVFQGAMAAATPKKNLTYTGEAQELFTNQKGQNWYSETKAAGTAEGWSRDIPEGTDAGTYTYYWTNFDFGTQPGGPTESQITEIKCTIAKASVNLTWTFDDEKTNKVPYTGESQIPEAKAAETNAPEITVTVKSGKTTVEPIDAGSYTATAALSDTDNFEIKSGATFAYTIEPAVLTVNWTLGTDLEVEDPSDIDDIPYDTKDYYPTVTFTDEDDNTIEVENYTLTVKGTIVKKPTEAKNADKYTATVTLPTTKPVNYQLDPKTSSISFEITKVVLTANWVLGEDFEVDDPSDIEAIPYDTKDYYPSAVTFTDEDDNPVDIQPDKITVKNSKPRTVTEAKDADKYTATVTLPTTKPVNYELDPESANISFEITKAPVTLTWYLDEQEFVDTSEVEDIPYDGEIHRPTVSLTDEDGNELEIEVNLTVKSGSRTIKEEDGPKNAGTYKATAALQGADNFDLDEESSETLEYKIIPAEVYLTWNAEDSYTYNGEEQGPTAEIEDEVPEGTTVKITYSGYGKNAGDYTAKAAATFTPANYKLADDAETEYEYTIDPMEVTLTWSDEDSFIYNGKEQGPEATVEGMLAADKGKYKITYDGLGTDAGDYTAAAEVTFSPENYVLADDAAEKDYTIEPVPLTLTWYDDGKAITDDPEYTYNGKKQAPTVKAVYKDEAGKETDYSKYVTAAYYDEDDAEADPIDAGSYTAKATPDNEDNFIIEEGDEFAFSIAKADITEDDFTAPEAIKGLVFNGENQTLITAGEWKGDAMGTFMYNLSGYSPKAPVIDDEFSEDLPESDDAGDYTVQWYIEPDDNHNAYEAASSADSPAEVTDPQQPEIAKRELDPSMITITPDSFYFDRLEHTVNYEVSADNLEESDWQENEDKTVTSATQLGTYTVCIEATEDSVNFASSDGPVCATWEIKAFDAPQVFEMFRFGDSAVDLPAFGTQLPATGFPTRAHKPLSVVRPVGFGYVDLGMRIQIPTLGIDTELTGVPELDGTWPVELLESRAGLLSGSFAPGEGISMVAAHNHLNSDEIGPFVLLRELETNDVIFVNKPNGDLARFSVYANELLEPNDMQQMASIAKQEKNTLILVTCENEAADGGYLNRRVVFAKSLN